MTTLNRTALANLTFETSYFTDEVREGFFISSMMKRYWAAQLTVLAEIDRVCRKYNIPWYADCGTLLGAVRHGGFIPWDDDLDICMMRHDWIHFFEVAKDEMPQGYCVLNLRYEEEYENRLGRIVNSRMINYGEKHLKKFHGCPYSVGVDIFPLDGLSNDEMLEEKRDLMLQLVDGAMTLIVAGKMDIPVCRQILEDIEKQNNITLHRQGNILRELRLLEEELYSMYSSENAEYVALMPFWISDHNHRYRRELFRYILMLPFENTYISVPARYDEVLRIEYGEYMSIHKGGGVHEYPAYKVQEKKLTKIFGANPYRFTINKEMLKNMQCNKPVADQCYEITGVLRQAHLQLKPLLSSRDLVTVLQILEGCQSLAIKLGTLMEEKLSGSEHIVRMLEDYCELVYESGLKWSGQYADKFDSCITIIESEMNLLLTNKKKEILFLPCKLAWWEGMESVYREVSAEYNTEIYVMAVPYQEGDRLTGVEGKTHNDGKLLPEDVELTTPEEYDIVKHHPDVIYTHYPYDEWCTTMDVPKFFYSKNLVLHTQKLVYLPPFDMDAPIDNEDKANAAIEVLIEQPAVLEADEVLVSSEGLRKLYVDTLSKLSGNKDYWAKKITVRDTDEEIPSELERDVCKLPQEWKDKLLGCKLLLFRVNVPFLLEHGKLAIDKLRNSIKIIENTSENVVCLFSPDEGMDRLKEINIELWKYYGEFIEDIKGYTSVIYDEHRLAENYLEYIDGYYGCAGNLAHKSRNRNIPVMIMNATAS